MHVSNTFYKKFSKKSFMNSDIKDFVTKKCTRLKNTVPVLHNGILHSWIASKFNMNVYGKRKCQIGQIKKVICLGQFMRWTNVSPS